jgi:hypothetical protein
MLRVGLCVFVNCVYGLCLCFRCDREGACCVYVYLFVCLFVQSSSTLTEGSHSMSAPHPPFPSALLH